MIAIEHAVFDVGNVLAHGGEARLEKAQARWGDPMDSLTRSGSSAGT